MLKATDIPEQGPGETWPFVEAKPEPADAAVMVEIDFRLLEPFDGHPGLDFVLPVEIGRAVFPVQ